MSTIAAREAAANIGASLSPALAKEAERKREAAERRANRNKVQARKDELVSIYLERQREWMREEAFDPKFNFPDVHGKPVDTSARGWKRDLDQRHMVTDDDHHQLKHHTCVYKFKDRVGGGGGGKSGAETATDDSDTDSASLATSRSSQTSSSRRSARSSRATPTGGSDLRGISKQKRRRRPRAKKHQARAAGETLKDGKMLARASAKIGLMRPTIVGPLRKYRVVHLSAGMHHVVFVTHHGQMLTMGGGRAGQLGQGPSVQHSSKPVVVRGGDLHASDFIVSAVAGASHTAALTRKEWGVSARSGERKAINRVYAFGGNARGQLGLGESYASKRTVFVPRLVAYGLGERTTAKPFEPESVHCKKLAAGAHHTIALAEGGLVFVWGGNQFGQLGDGGNAATRGEPTMLVALRKEFAVDVAAGDMHNVVITRAGDVWSWGRGTEGQLGHGTLAHENTPRLLAVGGEWFRSVAAGRFHTLCTTTEGHVRAFGKDAAGMLGHNGREPLPDPGGMRRNGRVIDKLFASAFYKDESAAGGDDDRAAEDAMITPASAAARSTVSSEIMLPRLNNGRSGAMGSGRNPSADLTPTESANAPSPSRSPVLRRSRKIKAGGDAYCPRLVSVAGLGPSVVDDRESRTAAILHRAHHGGRGRDFESDNDFITEVSAGAQHSVALTKRGLAYTFGYAGGNGRLGHGDALSQMTAKHVTVLQDDAKDADAWTKRNLIERMVSVEKQHTPVVTAASADPKDVDRPLAANRVSDELCQEMDSLEAQAKVDNFAFECMRAFRSIDKRGRGELSYNKMRPALSRMRIPLRSVYNPISCRRFSVDALCDATDEDEEGVVAETPFIEYLVGKHVSRKKGIPRKKWSRAWRLYKQCRGKLADLRPDPDGRSTFINALEDLFIDTSLELSELVSKEQCRMMFEFEILPEVNDDGSRVKQVEYARDKLPEGSGKLGAKMDLEARENSINGGKARKSNKSSKNGKGDGRGRKNWNKVKHAVKAGNAFSTPSSSSPSSPTDGRKSFKKNENKNEKPKKLTPAEQADRMGVAEEEKNRHDLVSPKTTKKNGEMEPEVAQPELLYGVLDLRGLGMTDKHVQALAKALRTVPAVQTIDLRQNYISDKGISALLDTMHFHHELAQYDSTQTLCGKCSSVLNFTDAARQAVFCIDCKIGQWRPAYLLSKVIVREDEEYVTPSRMLKWFEVDYDREACAVLAARLNEDRSKSLTRHEYTELHQSVMDEHAAKFASEAMDMVDRIIPPRKARKKKRYQEERDCLLEEVDELEQVLRAYGRRMFNGKHVPRYGLVAVAEIQRVSATLRTELIEAVYAFFHAHVPLENDRLLEGVQAAHLLCAKRVDDIRWDCREMKVRVHEILYTLAAELYEHYLILNAGATVYQTASGHSCTYLLTREGTVLSMGSSTNIVDSFKEQIITRLPDRFRADIEKGRAAERLAAAAEGRKRAALVNVGGNRSGGEGVEGDGGNLSHDASPLVLPSKDFEAFDMDDMRTRFEPPPRPGESGYVDDAAVVAESHKEHEDNWIDRRYHEHGGPPDEGLESMKQDEDEDDMEDRAEDSAPLLRNRGEEKADPGEGGEEAGFVDDAMIEVVPQKFVGNRYMQGRFRPGTAMEQILDMRQRANDLIAEQNGLIAASLGQDKVKEYKRIADKMKSDKETAEAEKAKSVRHVLWNLDVILAEDKRRRDVERKFEERNKLSADQVRRRRLAQSRTAGIEARDVKDLFMLFPGANKRFVEALFEANGGAEGMDQTVGVLADLKDDGVFDTAWDPEGDEDVLEARAATKGTVFDLANFDASG